MFEVNRNPTPADCRRFGHAMVLGFTALGLIVYAVPAIRSTATWSWQASTNQLIAAGLGILGLTLMMISLAPLPVARPVYVTWMTAATAVGKVMSLVMLTLLFALFLPVFSLIVRAQDPLRKKLHDGETYWEDYKEHEPTLERLRRPF